MKIASGSFSNVYNKNGFAIKKIHEHGITCAPSEILVMLSCRNCQYIPKFDHILLSHKISIVMELFDKHVFGWIAPDPVDFAYQITAGLQYIHDRGFIHGDIKTSNILYKRLDDGTYKYAICDFGLSVLALTTKHCDEICTHQYRPIEVDTGRHEITQKIDVWSFACVMYEVITGEFFIPAEGTHISQIIKKFKFKNLEDLLCANQHVIRSIIVRYLVPRGCKIGLAQIIGDCFAPSVDNRLSSCEAHESIAELAIKEPYPRAAQIQFDEAPPEFIEQVTTMIKSKPASADSADEEPGESSRLDEADITVLAKVAYALTKRKMPLLTACTFAELILPLYSCMDYDTFGSVSNPEFMQGIEMLGNFAATSEKKQ